MYQPESKLVFFSQLEVEAYMLEKSLVIETDNEADSPTDSACTDEQHDAMEKASGKINIIE